MIYILSRDLSHVNSHLEMQRKNWGKEGRGDSIQTTTHMQLKREATQANKLSKWTCSREKSHCTRMLKWDCSIPGQSGSGLQLTEKPSPCPGLLQPLLPYNQALPAGSLLYKYIMENTFQKLAGGPMAVSLEPPQLAHQRGEDSSRGGLGLPASFRRNVSRVGLWGWDCRQPTTVPMSP